LALKHFAADGNLIRRILRDRSTFCVYRISHLIWSTTGAWSVKQRSIRCTLLTTPYIHCPNLYLYMYTRRPIQCESKKNPHWNFLTFFPNGWDFSSNFTRLLSTLDYKFLFNYLQRWRSHAILSATTIMCSKCPPSTETQAGWSHLIWHNFVTVGDKWIKICILAYVWTLIGLGV